MKDIYTKLYGAVSNHVHGMYPIPADRLNAILKDSNTSIEDIKHLIDSRTSSTVYFIKYELDKYKPFSSAEFLTRVIDEIKLPTFLQIIVEDIPITVGDIFKLEKNTILIQEQSISESVDLPFIEIGDCIKY